MKNTQFMTLAILAMLMPSTATAFKGRPDQNKVTAAKIEWAVTKVTATDKKGAEGNRKLIEGWIDSGSAREAASAIRCINSLPKPGAEPEKVDLKKVKGLAEEVSVGIKAALGFDTPEALAKKTAATTLSSAVEGMSAIPTLQEIELANQILEDLAKPETWDAIEAEMGKAKPPIKKAAKDAFEKVKSNDELKKSVQALNEMLLTLYSNAVDVEVDRINDVSRGLIGKAQSLYDKGLSHYFEKIYEEQNCDDSNVLCLDTEGLPIKSDLLPATLTAGKKIKVVVITEVDNDDSFFLTFSEIERVDVLVRADSDNPDNGEESAESKDPCKLIPEEEVGYKVAVAENFTIPKSIGVVEVSIDFKRIPKAKGEKPVTASYGAYIEHGKYYIDLGLFVPFAIAGKRKVVARQIGQERYLAVETDLSVTAGLAMNVFPGGRRRGEFTPWSNLRCPAEAKGIALRNCRRRARARPWAELLGLQIGADLDVRDPIDQFYFGLVLEPVTGVTLSSGVAVMKIDHLKAGLSEGQLVASDDDMVARQLYGARPFLSFGLSLDLVQAIRAARERLAAQKP